MLSKLVNIASRPPRVLPPEPLVVVVRSCWDVPRLHSRQCATLGTTDVPAAPAGPDGDMD
ncbi:hypothetical protein ACFWDI_26545 [Streptomyces sp. NPDC060064]|uniref:hypothetical protein n=1 Tax=Streptomyces sp. NPDC060064 TaxID=3347049 RepID=UPI0036855709